MSPSAECSRCVVEPADVLDDRELELGARAPDAVGDQLGLEAVDEALGHGVVVGVADRPDRRRAPGDRRAPACSRSRCIASRHRCAGSARSRRPATRSPSAIRSASSTSVVRMLAANCQPTTIRREHVDDEAEEHDALPAAQVREVADPQPVRRRRREVTLDEIPRRAGPAGPAWWSATACRVASRPGSRWRASAARPGSGRPAQPSRSSAFHIRREP